MNTCAIILFLLGMVHCTRDFYMGMFKRNDFLVAQDRVFKEKVPNRRVQARYLKVVQCPITYLRVVDRLGVGAGPTVKIVRGGLLKNHIYLYMTSPYDLPISVGIYIGCPNNAKKEVSSTTKSEKDKRSDEDDDSDKSSGKNPSSGNQTSNDTAV